MAQEVSAWVRLSQALLRELLSPLGGLTMPPKLAPRNPYVAGKALGDAGGFFGREDIFRLVETVLSSSAQNAVVLFGQRRIGKTSILLQLHNRLPSPPFRPIYFDLLSHLGKRGSVPQLP